MNADEALRFIEELIRMSGTKPLNDLQRTIFRGAWMGKDYKEIHQDCGQVGLDHMMRNVGPRLWRRLSTLASDRLGEAIEVRKESLQGPIERLHDRLMPTLTSPDLPLLTDPPDPLDRPFPLFEDGYHFANLNRKQSWGEAPDAALFQGRGSDLNRLCQWVEEDGCRLIALVGTAGIGKTDLSVKLTERLRDRFELVVWRSLDAELTGQAAPCLIDLLTDLLQFLWESPPARIDLTRFMECLRQQRCLIVLDGFEAVLQRHVLSGDYHPDYENYSDLLKRLADTQHQSCVVLTSREKPREIEAREGEKALVRSYPVLGLMPEEVEGLFFAKGEFAASEPDWRSLTYQYDGNPRCLQQVATTITIAFGRDISRFLRYQPDQAMLVGDMPRSLADQMARLSEPERRLLQELAQYGEPATLEDIQQFVNRSPASHHWLDVLLSLVRRSLLTSSSTTYSLHPLIRHYITQHCSSPI